MKIWCQGFFFLLLWAFVCNQSNETVLELKSTVETTILPQEQDLYIFRTPDIPQGEDLYITVQPSIPDPLQLPYLTIISDGYHQNCYNAHTSFSSVCKIPHQYLLKDRQFHFAISCSFQCHLIIKVYTNDVISLRLGQELILSTFQQMDQVHIISLHVDQNEEFSSLKIEASLQNLQEMISEAKEGILMLMNWGDQQTKIPTEQNFMQQSEELYSGGRVALLSKDQIKPGNWLKIYLKLSKRVKVKFNVIKNTQEWSHLQLGKFYFDTMAPQTVKIYRIQTLDMEIQTKTIELVFDLFSGNPNITIGFDDQFNTKIQLSRNHPSINLQLTPQMRKTNNFSNTLFIKLSTSDAASQYQFYSQIVNQDLTLMKANTVYFDELKTNQIYQYIFDEKYALDKVYTSNTFQYNYSFKLESSRGKGKIVIARCKEAELSGFNSQDLQSCIIKEQSEVTNSSFIERKIETSTIQSGSLAVINLNIDVTQCSLIERKDEPGKGGTEYRHCVFQIVTFGNSEEPWVYSIYGERKFHINYLREGEIIKEYLTKDSYTYFTFSVPASQNCQEIVFFTTTLSGRSVLLVSSQDQFPTIKSTASDLITDSGSTSSVILKGEILKRQNFYISVYSQAFSEVNIGVIVHRNSSKIRQFVIKEGNIISSQIPKGQTEVHFKMHLKYASNILVSLNEVVGLSEMKVLKEDGSEVICSEGVRTRQTCSFKSQNDDLLFTIVITGLKEKTQEFTIVYMRSGLCKNAMFNSPIFVTLSGLQADCYIFQTSKARVLSLSTSLTPSQMAFQDLLGQLQFNGSSYKDINIHDHQISLKQMMIMCPELLTTNIQFAESCKIGINFISVSKTFKNFYFSLDQADEQMALFDGVQKKITHLRISQDQKFLYYKITSDAPIKIISSTSNVMAACRILASFVSKTDFLTAKDRKALYPKVTDLKLTQKMDHLYENSLQTHSTSIISISSDDIKTYLQNKEFCYLLISVDVSPLSAPKKEENIWLTELVIQVVQTETTLDIGMTKTGYVIKDNVESYLVNPENAIVILRTLDLASSVSGPCASIQPVYANGTVANLEQVNEGNHLQVQRSSNIQHILVKGILEKCSYQISYISLETFLQDAQLSQPYQLNLNSGDSTKFIYYHANYMSFKIVKLIGAGNLDAYIMPIKATQLSMTKTYYLSHKDYPIVDSSEDEHVIQTTDKYFCFECYYLVAFSTETSFRGEVIFLRSRDKIPLTTNFMMKEWLLPNSQYSQEQYIYYSLTDFNITIEVISGKVQIKIEDPTGHQLYDETVSSKLVFQVTAQKSRTSAEFYSLINMYSIKATTEQQTVFYIRVDKNRITERIFEGLPATFQVSWNQPLNIEFINGQKFQQPLNLLIEAPSTSIRPSVLNFNLSGQNQNGQLISNSTFLVDQIQLSHNYMLTLNNFKGKYYLSISSSVNLNVTVILLKQELTHLFPSSQHMFNKEGTYQIFTNDSNVLVEVYKCKGDFYLMASKNFKDTKTLDSNASGPITLRRPNYAGHYVLSVEGIFGSYYMRIRNKMKQSQIQYIITYIYYDSLNPYDYIDATNFDLAYELVEEGVQILINSPRVIEGNENLLQIRSTVHYVYVSTSKDDLKRFSQCGIRGKVNQRTFVNKPKLIIDKGFINEGTSFHQNATFFISVEVTLIVGIKNDPEKQKTRHLTFLYNPLQISPNKEEEKKQYLYFFTDNLAVFISWMLLPFALSAIIVYYILRFCIRKLMMTQGNMVEEVEIIAASTPTIPTASNLVASEGIVYPDSAQTKIKQTM